MPDDSIYIDPHFFRPPNVVDLRDTSEQDGNDTSSDDNTSGSVGQIPSNSLPSAPSTFEIVEQTVRQPAGGITVIDLVIEVPDQMGVIRYEVRLSKKPK